LKYSCTIGLEKIIKVKKIDKNKNSEAIET
jgi:hypothetical protein